MTMSLDEAIKHAEEVAEEKRYEYQECLAVHDMEEAVDCGKCAEEHRQFAEWLKELKQLKEQGSCENCISRQAALDAISRIGLSKSGTDEVKPVTECLRAVEGLSPVTPQPKTGHWKGLPYKAIEADGTILFSHVCDSCNGVAYFRKSGGDIVGGLYCPNCGSYNGEKK